MESTSSVISPYFTPISSLINPFCTVIVRLTRLIIYFFRQLIQIYPAEKLNYLPGDGNKPADKSPKNALGVKNKIKIASFHL